MWIIQQAPEYTHALRRYRETIIRRYLQSDQEISGFFTYWHALSDLKRFEKASDNLITFGPGSGMLEGAELYLCFDTFGKKWSSSDGDLFVLELRDWRGYYILDTHAETGMAWYVENINDASFNHPAILQRLSKIDN